MLFKIGDKIINPNDQPCAIIFNDAEEKNKVAEIITRIAKNPDNPESEYWFSIHPSKEFDKDSFNKWASLTNEDRVNVPVVGKPVIEL